MRTAQLHSSSYLSFIFVSKEGVSQSTGRVDGWGAGQCGVGLSSAGMEGSEGQVDGGPSRLLKPKYSVPFQDLSLGRATPRRNSRAVQEETQHPGKEAELHGLSSHTR